MRTDNGLIEWFKCVIEFIELLRSEVCSLLEYGRGFAKTIGGVRKIFCSKYGMNVNLQKSKIIVFRNVGIIKWYYKGKFVNIV